MRKCKLCGGEPLAISGMTCLGHGEYAAYGKVTCRSCHISVVYDAGYEVSEMEAEEKAIAAWNALHEPYEDSI